MDDEHEQVQGVTTPQRPVLPHGVDVAADILRLFPTYCVDTVFDVGANLGQSAKTYLSGFPQSQIYCFEPVSDTFRQLKVNQPGEERLKFFQLALGSTKRKGEMVLQGTSDLFFLLGQSRKTNADDGLKTEKVRVTTLDAFCQNKKIKKINYLKIDTEGGDLDVIIGGEKMLKEQRIDFVEVEAGMNPDNKRHMPFEALKAHFELRSYYLFGLYEQIPEWPTHEANLRRCNPVFMSQRMIKMDV